MAKFVDSLGLKKLVTKIAEAVGDGTWLPVRKGEGIESIAEGRGNEASGSHSHAEGKTTKAKGNNSHAEGYMTTASGGASHAQGSYNHNNPAFIDMVGVGSNDTTKNASVIYVKRDTEGDPDLSDPKNGYQYLLGVGGYQGQDIAEGMKSVQEVITDLEKGVAATETMTVEEIREIMSA